MKHLFFISLSYFILGNPFSVLSQVHFGVNTAINSTFVLDKGLSEDPRYNGTMTYNFAPLGVSAGIDLSRSFGLQVEGIWAGQGQLFEVLDISNKVVGERNIEVDYLHLPIMFKFMSASDKRLRTVFFAGPQLSFLRKGIETLQYIQSIQRFPKGTEITQNPDGSYTIDDTYNGLIIQGASLNADSSFTIPALNTTELLNSTAQKQIDQFKNAEVQIAASIGFDFDLTKDFYLSSLIRANYSLTDMRNKDLIDALKNSNATKDLVSRRANLILGLQLGIHYMIGGTRHFK